MDHASRFSFSFVRTTIFSGWCLSTEHKVIGVGEYDIDWNTQENGCPVAQTFRDRPQNPNTFLFIEQKTLWRSFRLMLSAVVEVPRNGPSMI